MKRVYESALLNIFDFGSIIRFDSTIRISQLDETVTLTPAEIKSSLSIPLMILLGWAAKHVLGTFTFLEYIEQVKIEPGRLYVHLGSDKARGPVMDYVPQAIKVVHLFILREKFLAIDSKRLRNEVQEFIDSRKPAMTSTLINILFATKEELSAQDALPYAYGVFFMMPGSANIIDEVFTQFEIWFEDLKTPLGH